MKIVIDDHEFANLSPSTRNEILARFQSKAADAAPVPPIAAATDASKYKGIDMNGVADLDDDEVSFWMEAAQEKTRDGLRVVAEHGPVIDAWLLSDAGIENVGHFQSRTTIRTRTVKKNTKTFLFGWDKNWKWDGKRPVSGRYAVTETTFRSLRNYFGMN